jgi:hypothetical protein
MKQVGFCLTNGQKFKIKIKKMQCTIFDFLLGFGKKKELEKKSNCCGAPVFPEWSGWDKTRFSHWMCTACNQRCEIIEKQKNGN